MGVSFVKKKKLPQSGTWAEMPQTDVNRGGTALPIISSSSSISPGSILLPPSRLISALYSTSVCLDEITVVIENRDHYCMLQLSF